MLLHSYTFYNSSIDIGFVVQEFTGVLYVLQGLTNQKKFHVPTGQIIFFFTCLAEKTACTDFSKQKKKKEVKNDSIHPTVLVYYSKIL